MDLSTLILGVSIYDHIILLVDALILIVIIMEGDFFIRKKKAFEKRLRKFFRDTKKYFTKQEVDQ
jgi:hypothetical protein